MTVFGNYFQDGIPNGWSPAGGQVRSPFGPEMEPGGSSTGSAVALLAGMISAAIGEETMGSIVSMLSMFWDTAELRQIRLTTMGYGA
jgi:amidase